MKIHFESWQCPMHTSTRKGCLRETWDATSIQGAECSDCTVILIYNGLTTHDSARVHTSCTATRLVRWLTGQMNYTKNMFHPCPLYYNWVHCTNINKILNTRWHWDNGEKQLRKNLFGDIRVIDCIFKMWEEHKFGFWFILFINFVISVNSLVTWEEVCASHENLPVDKA